MDRKPHMLMRDAVRLIEGTTTLLNLVLYESNVPALEMIYLGLK